MLMGSAGVAAEVALEIAAVEVNTKKVGEAGAGVEVTGGAVQEGRLARTWSAGDHHGQPGPNDCPQETGGPGAER